MRKGVAIAGAVILVIGIAAVGGGLYFTVDQSGFGTLGANAPKTSATLVPGQNLTVGSLGTGGLTIIAYSDNAGAPVQVSSGGNSPITKTTTSGGVTYYYLVFTALSTSTGSIVMHNNMTGTVTVQYAAVQSNLSAIARGGLLILGGGVLFIVGIILLIVGLVMKKKVPPGQQQSP